MAVYTLVSERELSGFLKNYRIGTMEVFYGIKEGIENSNFFLQTTNGRFILTLFEKRIDQNDLPFFLDLLLHLNNSSVLCPRPIPSCDGKFLSTLCGRPAVIVTFLKGSTVKQINEGHCGQVGASLGLLHKVGSGFRSTRKNDLGVECWRGLAQSIEHELDSIKPGLREELMEELFQLEMGWPHNLPKGIIHADLFPDNVFFIGGKLSGLIDFYFACTDSFAYDIAVCLNAWCFEESKNFNFEKSKTLLKKYRSKRNFSVQELEALPVLARGSAMRFLLTRCYDWINTPDNALVVRKDPIEFWERLCFHRGIESAEQYGIRFEELA